MSQSVSPEVLASQFFERPTSNTLALRSGRRLLGPSPAPPVDGFSAAWLNGELRALRAAGGGIFDLHPGLHLADAPIIVPWGVHLRGAGMLATHIRAVESGPAVIMNEDPGDRFVRVSDLRVSANKDEHAIDAAIAFAFDDSGSPYADPYWLLDHLLLDEGSGSGVHTVGRGAGRADRVVIRDFDTYGWHNESVDCAFSGLEISGSGRYGWFSDGIDDGASNARIWGSKCFYNGRLDGSQGSGFAAIGCSNISGFGNESQDNAGHGFLAKDGDRIGWAACVADSNNSGRDGGPDQSAAGFFFDNSAYGFASGMSFDRGLVASGNTRQQKFGFGFANGAPYTSIDLKGDGNSSGPCFQGWHTSVDIAWNASRGGVQERSYATSITPVPGEGSYIIVAPLTGNVTINPPSTANTWTGQELIFSFTQDGDGGAVVTFHAEEDFGYITDFVLNTVANKRGTVMFRYDGTYWTQLPGTNLTIPT